MDKKKKRMLVGMSLGTGIGCALFPIFGIVTVPLGAVMGMSIGMIFGSAIKLN